MAMDQYINSLEIEGIHGEREKLPVGLLIKKQYKQEYTTLGYYPTKKEALQALAAYNEQPYDLDNNLTVMQLYERWSKEYFQSLKGKSGQRTITSAWAYCSDVYDIKVRDLRARHIKGCIDDGTAVVRGVKKTASAGTKSRIKSIF